MTALSAPPNSPLASQRPQRGSDVKFYKGLVALNCAVPGILLMWDAYKHQLGANAVNFAIRTTGLLSLIFLLLSLTVTPVRKLTAWTTLLNYRRWLGLYAFFYGLAHFAIFFLLDREGSVSSTVSELLKRTYLIYGSVALLLMAPLAATSFGAAIRALGGKKWKLLHRASYIAAASGALHYFLLIKADKRQPLAFALVLTGLLGLRVLFAVVDKRKAVARAKLRPWTGELQVLETREESHDVRTFRLGSAGKDKLPFTYKPGQYLTLILDIDGKRVRRSYTIASTPTRPGVVELSIKRDDMGFVSRHLHAALKPGSRLKLTAPGGSFVFTGVGPGVILIGAGVGITPVMSMARYLTDKQWPGTIYFVRVSRTKNDLLFETELQQMAEGSPGLKLLTVITREQGHLSAAQLTAFIPELKNLPVYLCGPDAMMTAAREVLGKLGVPADHVFTEAFKSPASAAVAVADGDSGPLADSATVTFDPAGETTEMSPELTVLEASEACGVNLPFECRAAVCGTCKVKLLRGKVRMDAEDSLSSEEKADGFILACQARAVSAELTIKA